MKYNFERGFKQITILSKNEPCIDSDCPYSVTIFRWHIEFQRGNITLEEADGKGITHNANVGTEENISFVRKILFEDK